MIRIDSLEYKGKYRYLYKKSHKTKMLLFVIETQQTNRNKQIEINTQRNAIESVGIDKMELVLIAERPSDASISC